MIKLSPSVCNLTSEVIYVVSQAALTNYWELCLLQWRSSNTLVNFIKCVFGAGMLLMEMCSSCFPVFHSGCLRTPWCRWMWHRTMLSHLLPCPFFWWWCPCAFHCYAQTWWGLFSYISCLGKWRHGNIPLTKTSRTSEKVGINRGRSAYWIRLLLKH